ncbi:MAG: glycosyltransferase family 87 protein [Candidatus Micrarchaeaceae archaeon]
MPFHYMDRTPVILCLAIFALYISDIGFMEQLYFHPALIVALCLLGLVSAALFMFAYGQRGKKLALPIKANRYILAILVAFFLLIGFELIGAAVLFTVAALLAIGMLSRRLERKKLYAASIMIIVIASCATYASLYSTRNGVGIDEAAFNYYASYLLLHGANPYTATMTPVLQKYNIIPTYQLNGSIESSYDYPALSFMPIAFLAGHMPGSSRYIALEFAAMIVLVSIISASIVYKETKYGAPALIPIAVWLLATYISATTIDQYISVSLLLLLAYIYRKKIVLSGILLGLSASVTQLSWFALPFFYILVMKERNGTEALKSVAVSAVVFLLANSYFIIASPAHFFGNVFGLFGSSKLLLYGTNIAQVFVTLYMMPLWYPELLSIAVLLCALVMFYLYTRTLKLMLALVPAFIFMLTWRNLPIYGLAFVPLIIVMCYEKDSGRPRDMLKGRRAIAIACAAIVLAIALSALYVHAIYVKSDTISVNSVMPLPRRINGTYATYAINLSVSNNGDSYENVSFFVLSGNPGKAAIDTASSLGGIRPLSQRSYTLNFSAEGVSSNTRIFVMAFSKEYMAKMYAQVNTTKAGT